MKLTDKGIAYAQVTLSVVFLVGYFVVLSDFIHGRIAVPIEWKDTLGALLSVLTAMVLQIGNFWFSRSRESQPKTE